MKLFGNFEAVRFEEEDAVFVTNNRFLYYIYENKYDHWEKYENAGNDTITIENYKDVTREEITKIMNGVFPQKETDFLRLCNFERLRCRDLICLLYDDYPNIMSIEQIYYAVQIFMRESNVYHKSYSYLRDLFDDAIKLEMNVDDVINEIKALSLRIIGRDIYKKEIGIVDGHDCSSYFWIMPVRVIDYTDTAEIDNVAEMKSSEISIEENDVDQYLTPFLYKYFDKELEANKNRVDWNCYDDGENQKPYIDDFEWNLTYSFYTFDSIKKMLNDILDTIDALSSGKETDYTKELKIQRGWASQELIYAENMTKEQIREYNDNRPKEDNTDIELIIDFYQRFIYRMEYMMKVGKEKGFDLISFMGP